MDFEEIEKLDCEGRYEAFLTMVAEEREVWILVNEKSEFLKIQSEDHAIEYLPVWPHSDFTRYHSSDSSQVLSAKCIFLPEFFTKWIPGLEGDGLKVGVFPNKGSDIWVMEPSELKADLLDV
ncbi:Protein of unknown function [Alteromonadaceae bacterium Bs31]|nr:Protein of unknown function [Alteromonadaceae bacterium Bs31]